MIETSYREREKTPKIRLGGKTMIFSYCQPRGGAISYDPLGRVPQPFCMGVSVGDTIKEAIRVPNAPARVHGASY